MLQGFLDVHQAILTAKDKLAQKYGVTAPSEDELKWETSVILSFLTADLLFTATRLQIEFLQTGGSITPERQQAIVAQGQGFYEDYEDRMRKGACPPAVVIRNLL